MRLEADSIETLEAYLRSKLGNASHEDYFELNEANAMGFVK